jgi:hypothetical protein
MCFPRDLKTSFFKSLVEEAKSIAIPIQNLKLIFDAVTKNIKCPTRRVFTKLSIHKKTQTVDGFPHIRWDRAQKDL